MAILEPACLPASSIGCIRHYTCPMLLPSEPSQSSEPTFGLARVVVLDERPCPSTPKTFGLASLLLDFCPNDQQNLLISIAIMIMMIIIPTRSPNWHQPCTNQALFASTSRCGGLRRGLIIREDHFGLPDSAANLIYRLNERPRSATGAQKGSAARGRRDYDP